MQFEVDGAWTEPERFFTISWYGGKETRRFRLTDTPHRVKLTTSDGTNDWAFWKLTLTCACEVVLAEDPNGEMGTPREVDAADNSVQWWMGQNVVNGTELEFDYGARAHQLACVERHELL